MGQCHYVRRILKPHRVVRSLSIIRLVAGHIVYPVCYGTSAIVGPPNYSQIFRSLPVHIPPPPLSLSHSLSLSHVLPSAHSSFSGCSTSLNIAKSVFRRGARCSACNSALVRTGFADERSCLGEEEREREREREGSFGHFASLRSSN